MRLATLAFAAAALVSTALATEARSLPTAGVPRAARIDGDAVPATTPAFDLARRGADDAPGDDHGRRRGGKGSDDGPNHSRIETAPAVGLEFARRGADDAPGDDHGRRRGGKGSDDGPNHA